MVNKQLTIVTFAPAELLRGFLATNYNLANPSPHYFIQRQVTRRRHAFPTSAYQADLKYC